MKVLLKCFHSRYLKKPHLFFCLWSSSSSVSLLMVMMLTAGLGVSGMMMVCLGTWCWCWWSRVVLDACSASLEPQPLPPQGCEGRQLEAELFGATAQRGGVFSLTLFERWGDRTTWEEEDTSYADVFLMGSQRQSDWWKQVLNNHRHQHQNVCEMMFRWK